MTDHNQPVDPEGVADSATPEGEAQVDAEVATEQPVDGDFVDAEVVDAEVVPEEEQAASDGATPEGEGESPSSPVDGATDGEHPDTVLAAERLSDLQRLQAEYVNYKRRVDRDRADIQLRAAHDVIETLLPVIDEIQLARQHGDLTDGPMTSIADKLEQALAKQGLESIGVKGEVFDPNVHEALMHIEWDASDEELPTDATTTTVVTVLQPGYKAGERVLRPARVAVADPQ